MPPLSERPPASPEQGEADRADRQQADAAQPLASKRFRIWLAVKTAAVPAAAGVWAALGTFWSIFAWYHQEIAVPSAAPVNLVTEVTVQELGTGHKRQESDDFLDAIQVSVTASNVSTKTIHLLTNYWDAWAGKVAAPTPGSDAAAWLKDVNAAQDAQSKDTGLRYAVSGRFYAISAFERVGWGNLFPSTYVLYPKETISASVLFYIPRNLYDMLHVEVHIPTTERADVALIFAVDNKSITHRMFRIDKDGERDEISAPSDIAALKIQETEAFRQISLRNTSDTPLGTKSRDAK